MNSCARCREHFGRLEAAQKAVSEALSAPVPESRLREAVEGARARAGVPDVTAAPRAPRPAWLGSALAFGVVTFALGAWLGHAAWPREVVRVTTQVRPEIVERIVEKRVEVPVQVPVVEVRERVVMRTVSVAVPVSGGRGAAERHTAMALSTQPDRRSDLAYGGATPASNAVAGFHLPSLAPPVTSQEILPATIVSPAPPPDTAPGDPGKAELPDSDPSRGQAVACNLGTPSPLPLRQEDLR